MPRIRPPRAPRAGDPKTHRWPNQAQRRRSRQPRHQSAFLRAGLRRRPGCRSPRRLLRRESRRRSRHRGGLCYRDSRGTAHGTGRARPRGRTQAAAASAVRHGASDSVVHARGRAPGYRLPRPRSCPRRHLPRRSPAGWAGPPAAAGRSPAAAPEPAGHSHTGRAHRSFRVAPARERPSRRRSWQSTATGIGERSCSFPKATRLPGPIPGALRENLPSCGPETHAFAMTCPVSGRSRRRCQIRSASSAASDSIPVASSRSNRAASGLSRSTTATTLPSRITGTTSSDWLAASQAIWPGKA